MGEVEWVCLRAQSHRGGGNIQGEEGGEGKCHSMWSDSGSVVSEGTHIEEIWQESTADEGGGDMWGGGGAYVVSFPRVLKMVRFPLPVCHEVAYRARRMREHLITGISSLGWQWCKRGGSRFPAVTCAVCTCQRGGYSKTSKWSGATWTRRCGGGGRTSQSWSDARGRRSASQEKTTRSE